MIIMGSFFLLGIGCTDQKQGVTTKLGQSEQVGDDIRVPHNERLHLSTDKKWIEQEGHQSDLIRLQWTAERAKPAIVWMDENGKDKTAIISHDKANNPEQRGS